MTQAEARRLRSWVGRPACFRLPIVFGTIELSPRAFRLAHFDCETEQRWQPG
jgi:hypothetical protein